ncbi:filamentous hemagglutinin N-terminal domain-containing protein, partial [Salmonella enterica]|nr:filamentous hemagglutinin N-terminal domain-containing protein [Salmonella enterica]
MNKIYKLKFDKRRNELVVVSEITAGMGKEKSTGHLADLSALSPFRKLLGTLTPLALLTGLIAGLLPAMVLAADLPTGGQIVGGQGSISSAGNQMTIHQQTQNMATNWHSFDIGKNNTVQFIQPDSSAVALNRVTGVSGSQIMGTLKANGQVFILNPNGVLFGKDARVNVAGLVASTKNINTADFMKGQYTLSGSGNPGAQVINQGSLTTTKGGYIVLAGERVSNSGTITTPSGKTVLAAGKTVTLQLDNGGLTSVRVNGSVVNALVENRGLISATNGQVYLTAQGRDMLMNTVVNNSGTIEAKGLESRGGEIVLNGGDSGVVSQSGRVLADSLTGKGGKITLEGQNIHLAGNSLTSATGKTGGGEVYVGGGWQGKDSHIHNASKVVMDRSATVDVSATQNGNGGTAVLWSDDYTSFQGGILARGGAQSGNGGRVETSSHRNLQAFGAVDASARAGHGGEWLLDPTDVTIVSGDANTAVTESGKGTEATLDMDTEHVFSPSATGAQVSADKISEQLNAGTNVTVQTSGADTDGQSGNITVNANISKSAGADASLTLAADGNITLSNHSISSSDGKLDINLLGAGSNSGRVWINNSALNTNGGNITIDQLNHKTVEGDAETINPNAMTVAVSNGTLNTTSSIADAPKGDITVNAYNPNVSIATTNSVHNAGTQIQIGRGSVLTGGNIVLSGEQSGSNASRYPVFINSATITGDGDVTLRGVNAGGAVPERIEIRGASNTLTSIGGNITLENNVTGGKTGIYLNGNGAGNNGPVLTAQKGNITLNGSSVSGTGVNALNARMNAQNGSITFNGNGNTGSGVTVSNSSLNASAANINAIISTSGTGFSMTNTRLEGGLTDLVNVTFSSAGSGAGVTNFLDSSVVTSSNRDTMLDKSIENMTSIDMGGTAVFDDSAKDDKGWTHNYTHADNPNGGWIFNNTTVNAGGDVDVKGAGFTNSTVNVSSGNLSIDNNSAALLTGTTITVGDGAVNVHAGAGNIDLSKGNISAKGDITLQTDNGSISISGTSATQIASITSDSGNISVTGNVAGLKRSDDGVLLDNTYLQAKAGKINVKGVADGVNYYHSTGGVKLSGDVTFDSTLNTIDGTHVNGKLRDSYGGVVFNNGNFTFINDTVINATGDSYAGLFFDAGWYSYSKINLNFQNGNSAINAVNKYQGVQSGTNGGMAIAPWDNHPAPVAFNIHGGKLNITASAITADGIQSFGTSESNAPNPSHKSGYVFSGDGDVSVKGVSDSQNGIELRVLDNSALTGKFIVSGQSNSGAGVIVSEYANVNVRNASITGSSHSGVGVQINAADSHTQRVNLSGNTLIGTSDTSNGIYINGNNVTITHGTLNGTTTSGNGAGVVITGGTNYTIDGANITGQSANGTGVSVTGNLAVNNDATIIGVSTGSGDGVNVNGTLSSDGGVTIKGDATTGSGVVVNGNTKLNNATVSGNATEGSGIEVKGNLTNANTTLEGNATGHGAGVNIGGNITGGAIKGESASGSGVLVSGTNTTVDGATISGNTSSGVGVNISGNLTNTNGTTVNGSAAEGSGVTLGGNLSGGEVTGTSQTGSGVNITGDNSVANNTTLKGSSTSGTGVTISGNLTNTNGTTVNGTTNGSGSGVDLSGNITGGSVTGSSESGSGVDVTGADSTVDNVILTGSTGSGSGISVSGGLTSTGGSSINGSADSGAGITVNGTVNQGTLNGTSTSGAGAVFGDGANITHDATVSGNSTDGSGAVIDGNVSNNGNITGTSGNGTGTTVSGNLSGTGDVSG